MARVCSIDALLPGDQNWYQEKVASLTSQRITGTNKRRYRAKTARIMAVEALLAEANMDHTDIVRIVDETHPGLLDAEGNLPGDAFDDSAPQFNFEEDINAPREDRSPVGSPAAVSGAAPSGDTAPSGSRGAAVKRAGKSSAAARKSRTPTGAKPDAEPEAADPTPSKPAGQAVAEPLVGQEQRSLDIDIDAPATEAGVAQLVARIELGTDPDVMAADMSELMYIAVTGKIDENNAGWVRARDIAYGNDVDRLVWSKPGLAEKALLRLAALELNPRVWAIANANDLVPAVYNELISIGKKPTHMNDQVKEIVEANQLSEDVVAIVASSENVAAVIKILDTIEEQSKVTGGIIGDRNRDDYNTTIGARQLTPEEKQFVYKGAPLSQWLNAKGQPNWVNPEGSRMYSLRGPGEADATGSETMDHADNPGPVVVDKDAMRDAGFIGGEISNPKNLDPQKIREAPLGYAYVSGTWRLVTQEDVDAHNAGGDSERARYKKKLATVKPWEGHGQGEASIVFGSDTAPTTYKQAVQRIEGKQPGHIIADRLARQVARQTKQEGRFKIFDYDTDREITQPLSHGVVKMAVKRIMAKFNARARPRVMVFKNPADLRAKNPALYEEARTSRQDKKVIPQNAAGYAFGKTMLVFSDNIYTKKQLNFTISHEVIGHFGLGSVMPEANFNRLLDDLYSYDPAIQRVADGLIETRGLDKREATEEAMADAAATMDNSVVQRILDAVKRFLNRLGFEFTDDMTRYFVQQSRIYTRTGRTGDVSALAIYHNFQDLEARHIAGRAQPFGDVTGRMSQMAGGKVHGMSGKVSRAIRESATAQGRGFLGTMKGAAKDAGRALEFIQTMHNLAIRSAPMQRLMELFTGQKEEVERIKNKLNTIMAFEAQTTLLAMLPGIDVKGATADERSEADWLMSYANRYASNNTSEADINKGPRLKEKDANGQWVQSKKGYDKARAHTDVLDRKKLQAGFMFPKMDKDGKFEMEVDKNAPPIVDKKTGVSTPAMKHVLERVAPSFTITDNAWKLYTAAREAVDTSAMEVMFNTYQGMVHDKESAVYSMQYANNKLTGYDTKTIILVAEQYSKMLSADPDNIKDAQLFVREVLRVMDMDAGAALKLNTDWLGTGSNINPNTQEVEGAEKFRNDPDFAHIVPRLKSLHDHRSRIDSTKKSLESIIFDIHEADKRTQTAEDFARQTIMGAYVPANREGRLEGRIQAFIANADGSISNTPFEGMDPDLQAQLHYIRSDSSNEMEDWVRDAQALLDENPEPVEMNDLNDDGETIKVKVRFKAMYGSASTAPPLGGTISYDLMSSQLSKAGVNLTPDQRKRLAIMTRSADLGARAGLRRNWVPGTDPDVMRSVKKYLERQTHRAGKELFQNRITEVMAGYNEHEWEGNAKTLDDVQQEFLLHHKANNNPAATQIALGDMLRYQHQFLSSAPVEIVPNIKIYKADGTYETKLGKGLGKGYQTKARNMVAGYNKTHGMPPATGDDVVGELSGYFTGATAVLQLGGALAPAMVNMVSLNSHSIPFLSTLNKKTGYGGGHNIQAATAAIYRAMRDMNLITRSRLGKPTKLAEDIAGHDFTKGKLYGMNEREADFIMSLTESGVLTPSLINALTGVAESGSSSGKVTRGVELWMRMFTTTEQFNRRVTALASYRLEYARMEAAGKPMSDATTKENLQRRAEEAVYASQGNYDAFNRPAFAQGSFLKYLYIYKQFVVISVELMRNLGTKERLYFLTFLLLASGLKGLPFADDLMDIIDTLMQKFGIKWVGLEATIAQAVDAIAPGMSPLVLRGILDYFFGTTVSTRLAMGDLIPGTGMMKAGSSPAREFESVIGPVASAAKGVLNSAALVLRYGAETVGLQDDVTTLSDIARSGFGSSALKGYAEALVYASDGTITNARGQVVAADASIKDVVLRAIGFYPGIATKEHDVNRVAKAVSDYSKEITVGYTDAYLKADAAGRRSIRQQVREWNINARGTPFYIRDFSGKVQRSVKAAERTATARYLATTPLNSRQFTKDIMRVYGLDTKGIPFAP